MPCGVRENGPRHGDSHSKQSVAHDMRICLSITPSVSGRSDRRKLLVAQLNDGSVSTEVS